MRHKSVTVFKKILDTFSIKDSMLRCLDELVVYS